jgi:hypothetical protein
LKRASPATFRESLLLNRPAAPEGFVTMAGTSQHILRDDESLCFEKYIKIDRHQKMHPRRRRCS